MGCFPPQLLLYFPRYSVASQSSHFPKLHSRKEVMGTDRGYQTVSLQSGWATRLHRLRSASVLSYPSPSIWESSTRWKNLGFDITNLGSLGAWSKKAICYCTWGCMEKKLHFVKGTRHESMAHLHIFTLLTSDCYCVPIWKWTKPVYSCGDIKTANAVTLWLTEQVCPCAVRRNKLSEY